MITCKHEAGKIWESMFIPVTASGSKGISITWWGKNHASRGKAQCKQVSETEWYTTAKSKAVAGGYEVTNFIGTEVPITRNLSFVREIHDHIGIPSIPQMGFSHLQMEEIRHKSGYEGVGYTTGTALSRSVVTRAFIRNVMNHHGSIRAMITKSLFHLLSDEKDFIEGAINSIENNLTAADAPAKREKIKPEPTVNRADVYSTWGAFG